MFDLSFRIPFVHLFRRIFSRFDYLASTTRTARARRRQLGVAFSAGAHTHQQQQQYESPDVDAPHALPRQAIRGRPHTALDPVNHAEVGRTADDAPGRTADDGAPGRPDDEREPYTWPIHQLMANPVLFDPVCAPRHPIVLCHGLYGFDVRGPSSFPRLQMHYWSNVLDILRNKVGAQVFVPAVPSTGSVQTRAETLDKFLQARAKGKQLNFMAHSMGGLDCRHLISHIRPKEYTPVSLMSISTPHQGSPFMDWCMANIGIGAPRHPVAKPFPRPTSLPYSLKTPLFERPTDKAQQKSKDLLAALPASFTAMLLGLIDSPAYGNLTTFFCKNQFNPSTPDVAGVRYFSLAGRVSSVSILHPLWLPKVILDASCAPAEGGNDGLVSVASARWGEFLGVLEECDHWDMRGARGLSGSVEGLLDVFARARKGPEEFRDKDDPALQSSAAAQERQGRRVRDAIQSAQGRGADGDEVKSATDRLSSVFDWIAEHVPLGGGKDKDGKEKVEREKEKEEKRRSDLGSRADLERLYVALSRKLYDEGL